MKIADIKNGRTYIGKSGQPRTVIGPSTSIAWKHQADRDTIDYRVAGSTGINATKSMTRRSFASWARKEA